MNARRSLLLWTLYSVIGGLAFADVPEGYASISVSAPADIRDASSLTSEDKVALLLEGDLAVSPNSAVWWNSETPLIKGGNVLLTSSSSEGDAPSLTIQNGSLTAFTNQTSLTFSGLQDVTLSNSAGYQQRMGGSVYLNTTGAQLSLTQNRQVTFSGNRAVSSSNAGDVYGGAIYAGDSAAIDLSDNTAGVAFLNNTAEHTQRGASGGALYLHAAAQLSLTGNGGEILFSGNTVRTTPSNITASGGAIYGAARSVISLTHNEADITFSSNSAASGNGLARGGAIFSANSLTLSDNGGAVAFLENSAAGGTQVWGGAIQVSSSAELSLCRNAGGILFQDNYVLSRATSGTSAVQGGAIRSDTGKLSLDNNAGGIIFRGNSVRSDSEKNTQALGGAVYAAGNVSIVGNGDVLFEKNYERVGSFYTLRGLVQRHTVYGNGTLTLAAAEGTSITFYDSLLAEKSITSASGKLEASLNADYTDATGAVKKATGDIIFSGEHTADDLAAIKAADGAGAVTEEELLRSLTSTIAGQVNLYGGRLIIRGGAIFASQGLASVTGSPSSICLQNGTLDETGFTLSIGKDNRLSLQGANTLVAQSIHMEEGAILEFHLNSCNLTEAALTLNLLGSELDVAGAILELVLPEHLLAGSYKLIDLSDLDPTLLETWKEEWNYADFTVIGGEKDRLRYADGIVYYDFIPEPASPLLFLVALAACVARRKRR